MADAAEPREDESSVESAETKRNAGLRAELQTLARINQVVVGTSASLERARDSMQTVDTSVAQASALLGSWTRILSRSEHNQRLILDSNWNGASADISNAESEIRLRQREKQRREAEDARRREAAERKKAEDEARATMAAETPARGRGRGSAASRHARAASTSSLAGGRGAAAAAATNTRSLVARYGRVRSRGGTAGRGGRGGTS